ncbi:MAG: exodeoxyribonuclease VII large subunit [Nitrospinae bacterium]|nr:exodeoxyribonuclease VII large subunit [Nitrospinota bacterium]
MTEGRPLPARQEKEPPQPRIYSVSEVTQDIRAILESAFDALWVEGEISNLRVASSQHAYFVLKDDRAQVRCVMFRGQRAGMKYRPEDGDQVLAFGRITVYDARGEYQVIVETLEPRGLGALQKAFEQLKQKLSAEGLFDEARKRPLPEFPWKIGVVTSPTGAVIRDIIHVVRRRNPKVSLLLCPVKVQGEGAAEEIARAIAEMNRRGGLDVLIVGRGGGSIEDLWAFNEEVVARAIHASRIPVVSAVGHEVDFTIADFVADVRAPTPSAAAELTVPVLADVVRDIHSLAERLVSTLQSRVEDHGDLLRSLMDRRFFLEPLRILETPSQRLDDLTQRLIRGLDQWKVFQKQRLEHCVRRLIQASPQKELPRWEEKRAALERRLFQQLRSRLRIERERFEGTARNLNALSPLAILQRGYSICSSPVTGKAVTSSAEVRAGDPVQVRLAKGRLDCKVEKTAE